MVDTTHTHREVGGEGERGEEEGKKGAERAGRQRHAHSREKGKEEVNDEDG